MAILMSAAVVVQPLHAQETAPRRDTTSNNPAVATDGATLIHGNYCGAGNRPGKPPIDALDLACMNHDACSPTGGMPTCDCNERLRDEAAAIAGDPRQAPELRSLASLTAAAATVMICKPMLNAVAPPAVDPPVRRAPVAAVPAAPVPVTQAPAAAAPAPPETVAQAPAATAPVAQAPVAVAPAGEAPAAAGPMSIVPAGAMPAADAPAAADGEPKSRSLP